MTRGLALSFMSGVSHQQKQKIVNLEPTMSSSFDNDVLDDDAPGGPDSDYPWFHRPSPSANVTFALASILLVWTGIQFQQGVTKFGDTRYTGSLRGTQKLVISHKKTHHSLVDIFDG